MQRIKVKRKIKRIVRERDYNTCVYCGAPAEALDHLSPYSWNINNSTDNLACTCNDCNLIAGNIHFDTLEEKRDYILRIRSGLHWKRKLNKNILISICTHCKRPYKPRVNGSTVFLCSTCSTLPV